MGKIFKSTDDNIIKYFVNFDAFLSVMEVWVNY